MNIKSFFILSFHFHYTFAALFNFSQLKGIWVFFWIKLLALHMNWKSIYIYSIEFEHNERLITFTTKNHVSSSHQT